MAICSLITVSVCMNAYLAYKNPAENMVPIFSLDCFCNQKKFARTSLTTTIHKTLSAFKNNVDETDALGHVAFKDGSIIVQNLCKSDSPGGQ